MSDDDAPMSGLERARHGDEPANWRSDYRAALDALPLPDDDEILRGLAHQAAGSVASTPALWWQLVGLDLSALDEQAALRAVYQALSGCPHASVWGADQAVEVRFLCSLAFARGWLRTLTYTDNGELAVQPTASGVKALNAYQRRHGRPEFPQ